MLPYIYTTYAKTNSFNLGYETRSTEDMFHESFS